MQREQFEKWGRFSSLLWPALLVLVSACAGPGKQGPSPSMAPLHVQPRADGITPMTLTVVGEEGNVLLSSRSQLENGIKDFAEHSNTHGDNLKLLITRMRNSNNNPAKQAPGFTGIGGALGHTVLDIAEEALKPANGHYDQSGKRVVVSMEGKITHYKFTPNAADPTKGSGELTVITAVTSRVIPNGAGNPPPKTVGYKWEIEVLTDGFEVVGYDSSDPADPFPGTMTFSESMVNRIESLGFQFKLWAKGEKIQVNNIERDMNFDWDSPVWAPLPNAGPFKRLYESDSDSCIDMMFVEYPPEDFDDLNGPPWYCLGRCEHPAIVNSR